ncbi:centriolar coiled-coil protein of 110 kDa-like [Daphnia pulicaria]|uniref:centriolar coiled-coil protein of 110 kDa-like n=1 Tax=Daphnia pulicaria TaxID=35523 RepID=UPI001EEB90F6|nr:centriolar coiled-coil protein of 110 kDa-like [Daphnia pulicaria]
MSNTNTNYVSCIRVEGKPILPPLMNDDKRRAMRKIRDEAVAIESRLKEKRRAQLLEQVQIILDKCVTLDELNVSKVTPSKYRLISEPLLQTPVKINSSLSQPTIKPLPVTSYSLPSTPLLDDVSIENLHKKFLSMKQDCKDVSISESSAVSTDLGPYMQNSDSDSSSTESGTSTPRALTISDTDISTSLDCSTPIKSQRMRRLSYTLEAPSPVLLKMMQNKAAEEEKHAVLNVPKLNLSDSDELQGNDSNNVEVIKQNKNLIHVPSVKYSATISDKSSNISEENSTHNLMNLNLRPRDTEDVVNGNFNEKQMINTSEKLNKSKVEHMSVTCDNNGNSPKTEDVHKTGNFLEDFIMQQQKLMNELLEKQAKEQERLVQLFREQEEQLVMQMQAQTVQQPAAPKSKSPVCRSLKRSFDRSAQARSLFESGRLSALVRGYLTRRLMTTDRVQSIIQTIRDTTTCLKELNQGSMTILPSDVELHRRLLQQLNGAIHALHDMFFEWDVNERMLVIARDREKKAGQMIVTGMPIRMRPRSRSLSSATVKSLERKLTRQESQNSSRPSSASTALPRTSPSSMASSTADRKRSPSSSGSFSSFSAAPSNGSLHGKNKHKPSTRKPWRC